ncbi:hypothetical protein ACU4GD_13485 [Cupriavidus basilensis]
MYSFAALWLPAGYLGSVQCDDAADGCPDRRTVLGERLTLPKAGGVVLGVAGVAVLTRTGPVALSAAAVMLGAAACLVATARCGLAGFLARRWIAAQGGLDSRLVARLAACLARACSCCRSARSRWRAALRCRRLPGRACGWRCSGWGCFARPLPTSCSLPATIADLGPVRSL